eukprot:1430504-Prymnesium_polylepis.1
METCAATCAAHLRSPPAQPPAQPAIRQLWNVIFLHHIPDQPRREGSDVVQIASRLPGRSSAGHNVMGCSLRLAAASASGVHDTTADGAGTPRARFVQQHMPLRAPLSSATAHACDGVATDAPPNRA